MADNPRNALRVAMHSDARSAQNPEESGTETVHIACLEHVNLEKQDLTLKGFPPGLSREKFTATERSLFENEALDPLCQYGARRYEAVWQLSRNSAVIWHFEHLSYHYTFRYACLCRFADTASDTSRQQHQTQPVPVGVPKITYNVPPMSLL